MYNSKMGYKRIVHVLPEERIVVEGVQGDSIRSYQISKKFLAFCGFSTRSQLQKVQL